MYIVKEKNLYCFGKSVHRKKKKLSICKVRDSKKRRNLNYLDQNQLHMFTSILKQQQSIALMCGLIFVSFKDFVCYVKVKYKKLVQEKKLDCRFALFR